MLCALTATACGGHLLTASAGSPSARARSGISAAASAGALSSTSVSRDLSPCASALHLGVDPASRATMAVVRSAFPSRGHVDDAWSATVRVAVHETSRSEPGCTLWIEEESRGTDATQVVLGMESPGDAATSPWFFVAQPDGTMLRSGQLEDCSGCHAAAPRGVFPVAPQSVTPR